MHGRMSQIHIDQEVENSIFHGCSAPFWAVRYHSLIADQACKFYYYYYYYFIEIHQCEGEKKP